MTMKQSKAKLFIYDELTFTTLKGWMWMWRLRRRQIEHERHDKKERVCVQWCGRSVQREREYDGIMSVGLRKGSSLPFDQWGYQNVGYGNDGIGNWADWTMGLRHLRETNND